MLESQKEIYFDCLLRCDSSLCIGGKVDFQDDVRPELLKEAIKKVVSEHSILNAELDVCDDLFFTCSGDVEECFVDIPSSKDFIDSNKVELFYSIANDIYDNFISNKGPLFKVAIIKDEYVFSMILVSHHILLDGYGFENFIRKVLRYCKGNNIENEFSVFDYFDELKPAFPPKKIENGIAFWRDRIASSNLLVMPAKPGPLESVQYEFPLDEYSDLQRHIKNMGVAVLPVFLLAITATLCRFYGGNGVVIGTPIHNRKKPQYKNLIGPLMGMLPVKVDYNGSMTAESALNACKRALFGHLKWRDLPTHTLKEALADEFTNQSLFDISFNYQSVGFDFSDTGLSTIVDIFNSGQSKELLAFNLYEYKKQRAPLLKLHFNSEVIDRSVAQIILDLVIFCAKSFVSSPQCSISSLLQTHTAQYVGATQLSDNVNHIECEAVHHLIEQQAAKRPDHPAVVFQGQTLSYCALDARANQVANYLLTHHDIGRDSLVGLYAERSLEMVIGVLGILKAGGAYVPLDPNYPEERLSYMLSDTQAQVVLSTLKTDAAPIADSQCQWVSLHDAAIAAQPHSNPGVTMSEQDLAYIIYTSGSTGKPKGVMLEHRGVVNLVATLAHNYNIQPQDKLLQFAPISFDMSVEELFGALCCGSTLVLRTDEWLASVADFWAHCETHQISLLNLPTAFWHEVVHEQDIPCASHIRLVSVGGDKLSEQAIATWYETRPSHIKLLNAYGPTEYSVNATMGEIDPAKPLSIGHAVLNTQLLVLSPEGQLLPHGIVGELHLGGAGLARGYFNRPDLTAERFIDNPFYTDTIAGQSPRLYKTGDLVKMCANGEVEYVGRSDNQVKIRGFRIELGEIEAALASHNSVIESLVMAQKPVHGGEAQLLAYVLCEEACTPSD
ncbi:amino acid adenylation domain-containing protein, partial [Pseudoalteromonas sp. SMS1]|uniref:non-ribosomal peptide synthetase n=1 Tax=Pseudoalteromonas sp. SMS1 TaxID=2908894 RepID=UPI001F46CBE3